MAQSKFLYLFLCIFLVACTYNNQEKINKKYFDITGFFTQEIARLNKMHPGMEKQIMKGDEPQTVETDSSGWEKELKPFFDLEINKPSLESNYTLEIDSNKSLKIENYYSKDTNQLVQKISITKNKEQIQLIEGELKKRSFIVDRDVRLSYLPGRGYGIVVKENYIWSKPSGYEIFVQIKNPNELYR